jgi:hypothetical protein
MHRPCEFKTAKWLLLAMSIGLAGCGGEAADEAETAESTTPAPAPTPTMAGVMIHEPAEGAEVSGDSVNILLMADNITIAVAGDTTPGTGHHHLFINTPIVNPGEAIPTGNPNIVHLGKLQTSHTLTKLAPGEYTVIAVLGDALHRRIDPQAVDTVKFRVK